MSFITKHENNSVIYSLSQTETCGEISLQVPKVLDYFRDVILRRDMDKDSALLLNAGAHYVKVFSQTNFAWYLYTKLGYCQISAFNQFLP